MKERNYLINLYEIYKSLFTENQREYFEFYYYEDLSLSEISENFKVSRAFVSKTVNIVSDKLKFYEESLHIYEIQNNLKEIVKELKDKEIKEKLENLF